VKLAELRLQQARTGVVGGPAPIGGASAPAASSSGVGSNGSPGSGSPAAGGVSSAGGTASGGSVSVVEAATRLEQARTALGLAQKELDQAIAAQGPTAKSAASNIRAAEAAVRIARAQRSALATPAQALNAAANNARESLAAATADLARIEASTGIIVPANEVLFFPSLPLRVDDTKVAAGDALSGPLMTIATQRLAVDASVDQADSVSLRVGLPVEVEATDLDLRLPATITEVAATPGTNGAPAGRIYVGLTPTSDPGTSLTATPSGPSGGRQPTLADLNGLSVKVTIPISTTKGNVLAVPTTGVSAAADGSARVEVLGADGSTRFVAVVAGLRAEGYVEIRPADPSALREGDLVITGANRR
jgi:hypothetical protein